MTLLELLNRLHDRLRRDALDAELDEELRFHRQMLARDERDAGAALDDVPRNVRRRLGSPTHIKEETRDMWSLGSLDDLLLDLRYVLRTIRRTPAFSLVVTVTLALGIGATTSMFSVIDAILLRPLPYPAPADLVQLADVQRGDNAPASYPEYIDWKQRTTDVFSEVGTWYGHGEVLENHGDAEQLQGAAISTNVPLILGVHPLLGRSFRPDEEASSAPRVVMLGEALWRDRFSGDPAVLGKTVTLTGQPYVIIGVVPNIARAILPWRLGLSQGRPADFWMPLRLNDQNSPRGMHWLSVVGRLRPGVDLAQARIRLKAIAASLMRDRATDHGIRARPLADTLFGDYRTPLRLLLAAVALLLLIACSNVANLLLARAATRGREFAVRSAIGAGKSRVLRLVLVESIVRAAVGGACGIALAYAALWGARVTLGAGIPRMAEASIDLRALALTVTIVLLCGVAFGIVPALRAARGDLAGQLRDGGRQVMGSGAHDRVRRTLIIGEIALSFMLLATAGLLTRSFAKLLAVPKGFDPNGLVAGYTWIPDTRYPDSTSQRVFYDRLIGEVSASFGERNVTLANVVPISPGTNGDIQVEGKTFSSGAPLAEKRIVGGNYFSMLGARLVSGRFFQRTDIMGAPPVVVINETFAKRIFPGENPIGRRLAFSWGIDGYQRIVGVVADLREGSLSEAARPAVYISSEQRPNTSMNVLVRTSLPLATVAVTLRHALRSVDPLVPLVEAETMSDVVLADVRQQRLIVIILGSFAATALLLAAVGLFGVVSYSVAQRTQELGVRAALGALPANLIGLVLRQTATFAGIGIVLGWIGAVAARGLVKSQLFGVGATDAATFAVAAATLALVALVASAVPSWRAARADPLAALRAE
ncbi:MAG TPA: ABC transporter permease [Gemmatimonadaceae bacterium]